MGYERIGSSTLFQSALPLRGATFVKKVTYGGSVWISIRAPLAGSDRIVCAMTAAARISIRAPLAGSDSAVPVLAPRRSDFNPRSPCGERRWASASSDARSDFNPRSPCGERPKYERPGIADHISIRAPLAGSDSNILSCTSSITISIRAPLAGSDRETAS